MPISRRSLLKIALIATCGGGVASAAYVWPVRTAYRWLAYPALKETPPGSLSDATLDILLATAEALTLRPIEKQHYALFFNWRSEHLSGHRDLYQRFAGMATQSARRVFGCDFVSCEPAKRRQVLEPAFRVRDVNDRVSKLRRGLFKREWILFDIYIVRPIEFLFASTDAWRLAGYDAWPGTPRGLDRYTVPHTLTGA